MLNNVKLTFSPNTRFILCYFTSSFTKANTLTMTKTHPIREPSSQTVNVVTDDTLTVSLLLMSLS